MKLSFFALTLFATSISAFAGLNAPKDLHCNATQSTWDPKTDTRTSPVSFLPDFDVRFEKASQAQPNDSTVIARWDTQVTVNGRSIILNLSVNARPGSPINTVNAEIFDEAGGVGSHTFFTLPSGTSLASLPVTFTVSVDMPVVEEPNPAFANLLLFCTNR